MTTNRYLAEVLEDSRERLLAFVDRIAYVGFVPKGFADPANLTRVLEVQAGGRRPPAPRRLLFEHGMPPWIYAEAVRDHGAMLEPELRALCELTEPG